MNKGIMDNGQVSEAETPMDNGKRERTTIERVNKGLARRYRAEKRFKMIGLSAIMISLAFLAILFGTISITTRLDLQPAWEP